MVEVGGDRLSQFNPVLVSETAAMEIVSLTYRSDYRTCRYACEFTWNVSANQNGQSRQTSRTSFVALG